MSDIGLCKYRNALGVPGQGAHAYRFMGIAVIDLVLTIVVAILIARLARWSFVWTLSGLLVLGIVMHRLFCVRTTVDRLLFPNVQD
jgi:hypothetical protein